MKSFYISLSTVIIFSFSVFPCLGQEDLVEVKKLIASDAALADEFGISVSVDGDYAVIGAYRDDDFGDESGAAYVYYRNEGGGNNWGQIKKLLSPDETADDRFGISVAISGDFILVGADAGGHIANTTGDAYLFYRNQGGANNWGFFKKLNPGTLGTNSDHFGGAVDIYGDYAIVSAWRTSGATSIGAVNFYEKNSGGTNNWGLVNTISGSDAKERMGSGVSLGDGVAVAGGGGGLGSKGSSITFFKRTSGVWSKLKTTLLSDDDNLKGGGFAVSVNGNYAAAGLPLDTLDGSTQGTVLVFQKDAGGADNWGQLKRITSLDISPSDKFGQSVDIDGDYLIAGAIGDDDKGSNSGSAYIFNKDTGGANNWGQVKKVLASDGDGADGFGNAVSLKGTHAVVGAALDNDAGHHGGSAYMFMERSALPVELLSFTATFIENEVELYWETILEINNRGFVIERSWDGTNFSPIGEIPAQGGDGPNVYTFQDKNPRNGLNYYRLQQIDFDGTTALSDIVVVSGEEVAPQILLYPNPASEKVYINSTIENHEIRILNGSGQLLERIPESVSTTRILHLYNYPAGVYYIQLVNNQSVYTEKILISR